MAFSRRRFAEIVNARHPFFKLPTEIRNIIYGMSQLNVAKDDITTLTFGGIVLLFERLGTKVSLLHVCRQFRQELLSIFFAERQANLLYRGAITPSVPRTVACLSTDVLQMLQTVQLQFTVILPRSTHGLTTMLTTKVQVRLPGGKFDVEICINNNWNKCDHVKLLEHLGKTLDQLEDSLQGAMEATDVSEGEVKIHIIENGQPMTVILQDADSDHEAETDL